jgi:RNA polymerase sigma-70 factor (ECF subfamily)
MIEADFRRESARMVATLTRTLGPGRLDLAEDAVQEAFFRAMHQWPSRGTPPNPAAWLNRVARNYAIDRLRREGIYAAEEALAVLPAQPAEDDTLLDDELRMLLLCVHPALPVESQIALTLKTVCGLGVREIARGLLSTEEAVSQRIVRAKNTLRETSAEFDLPDPAEAASRVETVRRVLYLVFNEGYVAAAGEVLTDAELCDEALMLAARLAATPLGDEPATHALVALMLLHSSRLPARVGPEGDLRLLEDQDRTLWDCARIGAGLARLNQAVTGDTMSRYHAEAAIASCHAIASSFEATDWPAVLSHYDDLIRLAPSPIVRLNRVVALAMVEGYEIGLTALDKLAAEPKLRRYALYYATRGRLLSRLGRGNEARAAYTLAGDLATNAAEKRFLRYAAS